MFMNPQKAVVLLNMGGVSRPEEVNIFLTNMFNDKNIITIKSDMMRRFIATMIVASRTKEASENYQAINNSSPILKFTRKLCCKLQKRLDDTLVTCAMRYTPPFADEVFSRLKEQSINELFLLPMYPQYSTTTVKSSLEDAFKSIDRHLPDAKVSYIKRFYKNPQFIKLIVDTIEKRLPRSDDANEYQLIFSAHSLPERIIKKGDSYEKELHEQIELIKAEIERRGIVFADTILAYQSKLGPVKWLGPALEFVIKNMPFVTIKNDKGEIKRVKKTIIYPISFTIDNSETIYELSQETKEIAKEVGFDKFVVCPAPNYEEAFVDILSDLI